MTIERLQSPRPRPRPRPGRHDQPLEGRRIWDVGDWGNASNHIGRRWEEFGLGRLRQTTGPYGRLIELLGADAEARYSRLGLTSPDAILAESRDGHVQLRPVDCKWSLETASPRQVGAYSLELLLPHLPDPLRPAGHGIVLEDGFFFAPDTIANRHFLSSSHHHTRSEPVRPDMVVLEEVDPEEFFGALPDWPAAQRLAAIERAERLLLAIDGAERYYRLGTGVAGALRRLATPIFAEEPPEDFDPLRAIDDLAAVVRPFTVARIVSYVGRRLDDRAERVTRLRHVQRCPYSMRWMSRLLADAGIRIPDPYSKEPGHAAALTPWRTLHRAICEVYRKRIASEGLHLVEQGADEFAVLAALERREHDRNRWARQIGDSLVAEALRRVRSGLSPVPEPDSPARCAPTQAVDHL